MNLYVIENYENGDWEGFYSLEAAKIRMIELLLKDSEKDRSSFGHDAYEWTIEQVSNIVNEGFIDDWLYVHKVEVKD